MASPKRRRKQLWAFWRSIKKGQEIKFPFSFRPHDKKFINIEIYFFTIQTAKALSFSCFRADFLLIKTQIARIKKLHVPGMFSLNQQHENTLRARQRLIKFYERYKNVKRKYILCLFNTLLWLLLMTFSNELIFFIPFNQRLIQVY